MKPLVFPDGFLWGTATAAHQIEGGTLNNNWSRFEQRPGAIKNGDSARVACDHWNRYKEDFKILNKLNCSAYRMSIEWSRVVPSPGKVDRTALERYHAMIDELLRLKITPFVTLLHFTVPLWWEDAGGFLNRKKEHLDRFGEFCALMAREFRGKVRFWNTLNEIDIVIIGYLTTLFPPGEVSYRNTMRALDNLMMMHSLAYRTVKEIDPGAQVGIVHNLQVVKPYRQGNLADRMLAGAYEYLNGTSMFRALRTGRPAFSLLRHGGLRGSTDFFGVNYYNFALVSPSLPGLGRPATDAPLCGEEGLCAGIGWEPYPEGLFLTLTRVAEELPGMPIYVTENGIGTDDDAWRRRYIVDHLKMVHRAIGEDVPVKGYFQWSLMDNFEWSQGYRSRFGLVHVDYATQKRTVKESGRLFGAIAGKNAIGDDILRGYPPDIYRPRF